MNKLIATSVFLVGYATADMIAVPDVTGLVGKPDSNEALYEPVKIYLHQEALFNETTASANQTIANDTAVMN